MLTAKLIIFKGDQFFYFLLTEAAATPAFNKMPSFKTSLTVP